MWSGWKKYYNRGKRMRMLSMKGRCVREFMAGWVPCSIQFTGTICPPQFGFLLGTCNRQVTKRWREVGASRGRDIGQTDIFVSYQCALRTTEGTEKCAIKKYILSHLQRDKQSNNKKIFKILYYAMFNNVNRALKFKNFWSWIRLRQNWEWLFGTMQSVLRWCNWLNKSK